MFNLHPDIDHTGSAIGRIFRYVSTYIQQVYVFLIVRFKKSRQSNNYSIKCFIIIIIEILKGKIMLFDMKFYLCVKSSISL
ncbi:MAG: hypothetical protein CVV49_15825 [Spirochaetae bacterium HGW-Spirochaetae-5]|nr:MAG: hypothetical protein CVV49_15825 [Spirochaetae bacterium HGW-Spirochaetae-5]